MGLLRNVTCSRQSIITAICLIIITIIHLYQNKDIVNFGPVIVSKGNHYNSPRPNLVEKLVDTTIRFRAENYAYSADISKAFLRLGLQECDRDFTRFLWS